jgi:hypothetical protein
MSVRTATAAACVLTFAAVGSVVVATSGSAAEVRWAMRGSWAAPASVGM